VRRDRLGTGALAAAPDYLFDKNHISQVSSHCVRLHDLNANCSALFARDLRGCCAQIAYTPIAPAIALNNYNVTMFRAVSLHQQLAPRLPRKAPGQVSEHVDLIVGAEP
jgi:hypothetical protein